MIATISSKGQLTIPKPIRDKLFLQAGDKVVFFLEEDDMVKLAPVGQSVTKLKGMVPKPERALTLEEINDAIELEGSRQ
jgi:AbrB family looped-hinge helix DNA binding protein